MLNNDDDQVIRTVRVWMREVMKMKDWSAAEWARRANTSPTNITRVLSPTSRIVPNATTLAKLAEAAGSQPKLGYVPDRAGQPAVFVPKVGKDLLKQGNAKQVWQKIMDGQASYHVQIDRSPSGPAFVMEVQSNSLDGRGIHKGDQVLIEKITVLHPGNLVLVRRGHDVELGEWRPPFIMFRPPLFEANDPVYQPCNQEECEIIGRVTRLIRDL